MEISVQASHEQWLRPEIGRLRARAAAEAATKEEVLTKVTDVVTTFSAELKRLAGLEVAPVRDVIVRPITTSSWRPVNRGRMQPPIYTANATMQADFTDFTALADIAAKFGAIDGLNLDLVEWRLTDATQERAEHEGLTAAVGAAKDRALVMARAAGATSVRCLQLADPGLMSDPSRQAAPVMYDAMASGMMRGKAMSAEVQGIEIAPEDLMVAVQVQARFATDD